MAWRRILHPTFLLPAFPALPGAVLFPRGVWYTGRATEYGAEGGLPVPRSSPYNLPRRRGRERGAGSEVRVTPGGLWSGAVYAAGESVLGGKAWATPDAVSNSCSLRACGSLSSFSDPQPPLGNRSRQHVEGPAGRREGNLWDQGHWGKTLVKYQAPCGSHFKES